MVYVWCGVCGGVLCVCVCVCVRLIELNAIFIMSVSMSTCKAQSDSIQVNPMHVALLQRTLSAMLHVDGAWSFSWTFFFS